MIRMTIILDGERGEQLVGLLSKALSRGEQGIWSMQLEQVDGTHPKVAAKPHDVDDDHDLKALIKRLPKVPKEQLKPKQKQRPRVDSPVSAAQIIYDAVRRRPMSFTELRHELERFGFSGKSINTAMKRAIALHPDIGRVGDQRHAPYTLQAQATGP